MIKPALKPLQIREQSQSGPLQIQEPRRNCRKRFINQLVKLITLREILKFLEIVTSICAIIYFPKKHFLNMLPIISLIGTLLWLVLHISNNNLTLPELIFTCTCFILYCVATATEFVLHPSLSRWVRLIGISASTVYGADAVWLLVDYRNEIRSNR